MNEDWELAVWKGWFVQPILVGESTKEACAEVEEAAAKVLAALAPGVRTSFRDTHNRQLAFASRAKVMLLSVSVLEYLI